MRFDIIFQAYPRLPQLSKTEGFAAIGNDFRR